MARRKGANSRSDHAEEEEGTQGTGAAGVGAVANNVAAQEAATTAASATALAARGAKPVKMIPSREQVLEAVDSLYADMMKPFGRILRKRVQELVSEQITEGERSEPNIDAVGLRTACDECELLRVEPEDGGEWSAVLLDRTPTFVDVCSPEDVYPADLWTQAALYFASDENKELRLPGGRYSCAQLLMNKELPFLKSFSLGQVCHIVQLAISQKKLLGYLNGAVVPYSQSQSMVKERCAMLGQPCAGAANESCGSRTATWDLARECLKAILEKDPAGVSLSNIKRLFRAQYDVELSETALGHSRLSDLLQDPRFSDTCTVELAAQGYFVHAVCSDAAPGFGDQDIDQTSRQEFCPGEHLSLDDCEFPSDNVPFIPTPSPSPYPMAGKSSALPRPAVRKEFCPGEHLPLDELEECFAGLPFIPTPSPSPQPMAGRSSASSSSSVSMPFRGALDLALQQQQQGQTDQIHAGGRPPALTEPMDGMVHNTFIHVAPLPPTPARRAAALRSRSLPKDMGSAWDEWDMCRCAAISHSSAATTAPTDGSSGASTSSLACSQATWGQWASSEVDGRCPPPSGRSGIASFPGLEPMELQGQPGAEPSDEPRSQPPVFCPDEPLDLEDADIFPEEAPTLAITTPTPGAPQPSQWPNASPNPSGLGIKSVVRNTFIHAVMPPTTPIPGARPRASSVPKDEGSEWRVKEAGFGPSPKGQRQGMFRGGFGARGAAAPASPGCMPTTPAVVWPPTPVACATPATKSAAPSAQPAVLPPQACTNPMQTVLRLADYI